MAPIGTTNWSLVLRAGAADLATAREALSGLERSNTELEDVIRRLEHVRLPDQIEGSGWGYGTDRDTLEEWIASFVQ